MIGATDRLLMTGTTGLGKTNRAMVMVAPLPSVVVLDVKKKPEEWARWARRRGWLVTRDPGRLAAAPRVVLWIDGRWLDDRRGWRERTPPGCYWTQALEALFARRNTVVVFEDAHRTLPAYNAHPEARRLYTDGRALGLPAWCLSQAPSWLDSFVVRTSEHYIGHRTRMGKDLRRIADDRAVDPSILRDLHGREAPGWAAYHRDGAELFELLAPCPNVIDGGAFQPRRPAPAPAPEQLPAGDQVGDVGDQVAELDA